MNQLLSISSVVLRESALSWVGSWCAKKCVIMHGGEAVSSCEVQSANHHLSASLTFWFLLVCHSCLKGTYEFIIIIFS